MPTSDDRSPVEASGTLDQPAGAPPRTSSATPRTRSNATWAAVAIAVLLAVALIDFIVQNTRSTRIEFFSISGEIPVAVALLAAAAAGAFVVLAIGIARTARVRLAARKDRRLRSSTQ
jgi:uncharacterized integral membrane protein